MVWPACMPVFLWFSSPALERMRDLPKLQKMKKISCKAKAPKKISCKMRIKVAHNYGGTEKMVRLKVYDRGLAPRPLGYPILQISTVLMAAVRSPMMEAVLSALGTEERGWPDFVELYQPDKSIVLLSDAAKCESVEACLMFFHLPFERKYCHNAEFMSPNGEVPLLRAGNSLTGGVQEILSFIRNRGVSVSEINLKPQEKAEMMAYISLVEKCLLPAELYMSWCKKEWATRSRQKYGSPYPTPLNIILSYKKQSSIWNQLRAMNWHLKKEEEVIEEFKKGCQALAEKLGGRKYFIHDLPMELDAVVFGHLHTILTRYQPDDSLVSVVKMHKNLVDFVMRIVNKYFR